MDDYFTHAGTLIANSGTSRTPEVDLRRAISAVYYAVFHMLALTAAEHWDIVEHRSRFTRLYDHGRMKACSQALPGRLKERLGHSPTQDDIKTVSYLESIAREFISLQQRRHTADYDHSKRWSYTEAETIIISAHARYLEWLDVKSRPLAIEYLLDLIGINR